MIGPPVGPLVGPLLGLHVRRTATPSALAIVAGAAVVALLGAPAGAHIVTTSSVFLEELIEGGDSAAQSAWTAALVALVVLTLLPAARIPDRWFRSEGDWLGTAPAPRLRIIASTLVGLALGCVLLAATAGVVIAAHAMAADRVEPLLECAAVAGPQRSIVLMGGESFEQSLLGVTLPDGARVRVRVTPTLGGSSPTTAARHGPIEETRHGPIEKTRHGPIETTQYGPTGEARYGTVREARVERIARRTWLESEISPSTTSVRVTNVGEGALAVVGPGPVEVWHPSRALGRGHLRLATHVGLFLVVLAALAFGLGAWMSPGVATLLAFSLWLGARMLLVGSEHGHWLPGADGLADALGAIAEGRSPLVPTLGAWATVLATCILSIAATRPALHPWRREVRA